MPTITMLPASYDLAKKEVEFWKEVYLSCVKNGDTCHSSKIRADNAVKNLRNAKEMFDWDTSVMTGGK